MAATLRRRAPPDDESEFLIAPSNLQAAAEEQCRFLSLEGLRTSAALPFLETSAEHMKLLTSIWSNEFPGVAFELPSESWKQVGFQGRDPRTDLRGAGVVGLRHLQRFLATRSAELQSSLPPHHDDNPLRAFPLSIASINVTSMLLSHFQLAPKLTLPFLPGARLDCSAPTLAGFLSLGRAPSGAVDDDEEAEVAARVVRLESALAVMHERLLLHLATLWGAMLSADEALTIMDFSKALRATFAQLRRALRTLTAGPLPWQLPELASALEEGSVGGAAPDEEHSLKTLFEAIKRSTLFGLLLGFCSCGAARTEYKRE